MPKRRQKNGAIQIAMSAPRPPFFIVGSPRSGTTLLQKMFEAHPDVCFVHESQFLHMCDLYLQETSSIFSSVSWNKIWPHYLKSHHFLQQGIPPDQITTYTEGANENNWPLPWIEMLGLQQKRAGRPVLGEKTPHHVLYLETIFRLFPDSRALFLVRDPRAVVPSMVKAGFGPSSAKKAMVQWATLTACGIGYHRRYPDRILPINYESLVRDAPGTLQRLCDFLELPYHEGMLKYHELPEDKTLAAEDWKKGVRQPVYLSSLEHWKNILPHSDIHMIENHCAVLMDFLGYRLEYPEIFPKLFSRAWTIAMFAWKAARAALAVRNILSRQSYGNQALGLFEVLSSGRKLFTPFDPSAS